MFRVLTKNRIFVILSLCLSKIIKFEIELENISEEDLKDENIVFALPVDSASDLMALDLANKYQQIASPLDKLTNSDLERFICLKDPKYIVSEQRIRRQAPENLEAILDSKKENLFLAKLQYRQQEKRLVI